MSTITPGLHLVTRIHVQVDTSLSRVIVRIAAHAEWLHSGDEPEIIITDAQKSSEGAGSVYIAYVIRSGNVETRRRYSEFESLRNSLSKLYPTLIIPPFRSKAKEDANLIARRRRMLQVFLNRIARHPILSNDHVFHRFLERDVSWSEVLNSPPITLLPKNILKAPAHNPLESSAAHDSLPVPSPLILSVVPIKDFSIPITRRTSKRWAEYAHDTAELGAALNALSLSPPHESDAVERTGQAVDAAYVGATKLVQSIEAGWTEPMREYAMFAGIIRRLLVYRHQKHVQYEMTLESLDSKRETLDEPTPAMKAYPPPWSFAAPSADSLTQSPTQLSIPDPDDFNTQSAWGGDDGPVGDRALDRKPGRTVSALVYLTGSSSEATLPAPSSGPSTSRATSPMHKRGGSGPKGFLNALSHSFQGIMDLEDALFAATQDLKYASSTIQADLDRFQRQKVADIRDMCIAMAIAHRDWAKNNLEAWEEAKKEVAKIEPHPNHLQLETPRRQSHLENGLCSRDDDVIVH
ncbi:PhoX homologous domain, present in p47phox and p40phox [Rhizoctonia solani]|uniref:PhoX homologous domain, present in p47phox and p40phox n=1 Tax=Rhizoctonia solani TaxID=456999 RepID=A0A8H7M765_9AGAM|nr:PhoX homologous domain, present in p47phox and p40phox [Rhizoctonia solani]